MPVSFGYDGDAIFIHTAKSGRKIEFIEANPVECFELESDVRLQANESDPCAWTFAFRSVIGYGTIAELTRPDDMFRALNVIMRHYSGRDWEIAADAAATTRVWRIEIESIAGKKSVDKPKR